MISLVIYLLVTAYLWFFDRDKLFRDFMLRNFNQAMLENDNYLHDLILKHDDEAVDRFYGYFGGYSESEECEGVVIVSGNDDTATFSRKEIEILLKTPGFNKRFLRYWEMPDRGRNPKAQTMFDNLWKDVKNANNGKILSGINSNAPYE